MDSAIVGTDGTIRCPKCGATGLQSETSGVLSRAVLRCVACRGKFRGATAAPLANPPGPSLRHPLGGPAPAPPPPAGWAPPTGGAVAPPAGQTLRLLRTTKSIPVVNAIVAVRPDLSHAQARALLKAAAVQPQELLVGRPLAEIEFAAVRLRRAGVVFDVV